MTVEGLGGSWLLRFGSSLGIGSAFLFVRGSVFTMNLEGGGVIVWPKPGLILEGLEY